MSYPKFYRYHRIVRAKMFIDDHYSEGIDVENIANTKEFTDTKPSFLTIQATGFRRVRWRKKGDTIVLDLIGACANL